MSKIKNQNQLDKHSFDSQNKKKLNNKKNKENLKQNLNL